MYTHQEAAAIRQKFWVSFGKYIAPIPSSNGEKANWINYRTGTKFIQFKMDVDADEAYIAIEISHKQEEVRELYFNHFKTFKKPLEEILEEKWEWQPDWINEVGTPIARIYSKQGNLNVYKENDWPKIISFLKTSIIHLDEFWNEYREIFDMLN